MNRDFEQEYQELAKMEVPDLWDRIEAGLTEKSTPVSSKKSVVVPFIKRYSTLAAALLCAILIIPVLGIMKQAAGGSNKSGSAFTTEAVEDTVYESAAETTEEESAEAAEEAEAPMAEASAETEAFAEAEAPAEESFDGIEDMKNASSSMEDTESMEKRAEQENKAETGALKEDMTLGLGLLEGQILTGVIVEVTAAENDIMGQESIDDVGTRYTAVVQEDPDGVLAEGEEIIIFIPLYSSFAMAIDDTVKLDIMYCGEEKDYFTLAGHHELIEP